MITLRKLLLVFGLAAPFAVIASDVDEVGLGETVERHLSLDEPFMQWVQDLSLIHI